MYETVKTADWGGSNYPRLLLKALLCCPGRRGRREALLEMLWPEIEIEQASAYLNTATTKLRSLLRLTRGHESLLITEDDSTIYQLPDQEMLWVDSEAVHQALERADRLGRASAEMLPVLEEAIKLANRGTFLEGEEDQWAGEKRASRERERYRGCIWLAESYGQHGRIGQAETILNTLLDDDPFDEDVLCRLMVLLQGQGMMHQARLLYQRIQAYFLQARMDFTDATKNLVASLEQRRYIPSISLYYPDNHISFSSNYHSLNIQEGLSALKSTDSSQSMMLDRHVNHEIQTLFHSQMSRRSDLVRISAELQMPLQTMLVELDAIADKLSQEQYQFSRRQILSALAALPLAMLALDSSSSITYARDLFLPQCAASLVACVNRGCQACAIPV
jgi:DNA-binding SARP family transcriptional activator